MTEHRFPVPRAEVVTERVVLRRWSEEHAPALRAAVLESLDHLRPTMPWTDQPPDEQSYLERVRKGREAFEVR